MVRRRQGITPCRRFRFPESQMKEVPQFTPFSPLNRARRQAL